MTCIVGIETDDGVIMGGDALASSSSDAFLLRSPKVVRSGPYLVGVSGSRRFGDIMRTAQLPPPPTRGLDRFMIGPFVSAIRAIAKDAGVDLDWTKDIGNTGCLMLGVAGRIYVVRNDFGIERMRGGYHAIGCGDSFATGSLYSTKGLAPRDRVVLALEAAETHGHNVRRPWTILTLKK